WPLARDRATTACNTSSEGVEDGAWPRPRCAFPARRVTMPEGMPFIRSDASDRNADEPRPFVRLQLHQHRAFAIQMGILDGIAHVDRVGDLLPTDIEDDVAGLEAVRGGEPARVDVD